MHPNAQENEPACVSFLLNCYNVHIGNAQEIRDSTEAQISKASSPLSVRVFFQQRRPICKSASGVSGASPICTRSQLAKLANSLWHSQFISVFMCECLFIYFAPNRPICRHHLPTRIATLAIAPRLSPLASKLPLIQSSPTPPTLFSSAFIKVALLL